MNTAEWDGHKVGSQGREAKRSLGDSNKQHSFAVLLSKHSLIDYRVVPAKSETNDLEFEYLGFRGKRVLESMEL